MRWLAAIGIVVLLVLAYLYYEEFGLPSKVEEFIENLIADDEETALALRVGPTARPQQPHQRHASPILRQRLHQRPVP